MVEYDGDANEAPKSPFSQLFLRLYSPMSEEVLHYAMSFRHPIDVEAFKKAFANSLMIKHPRFCSLIVRNPNSRDGKLSKNINVNIDDHFFVHYYPTNKSKTKYDIDNEEEDDEKEAAINSFLAEISVSTPLDENKPLWEVHVLLGLKCVVLRVHHALGDGVSMMSMLSACFGKKNDEESKNDDNVVGNTGDYSIIKNHNNSINNANAKNNNKGRKKGVWDLMKSLWFTFVFMLRALGRILWVKDEASVVSGGVGVELWPRKLVTTKFLLEDFKPIKTIIPQVTINDVLLGVISSGLSKYFNIKSSQAVQQTQRLTAVTAVNLRKHPYIEEMPELMSPDPNRLSGWGNKLSVVLVPICCRNGLHPLDHVRAMKATMDRKKHSYEAHCIYKIYQICNYLGLIKVVSWCTQQVIANTTILMSNIKGPSEEIAIADNPVTHMTINLSSLPQAITIYMVSYAGKASLQVLVAKDIIPDPEILVNYFQESFMDIRNSIKKNN